MSSLISELDRVLKYGLAPIEELHGLADEAHAGGTFNPHNHADGVLADKLQDHDDPRHHIVRRDLEYRQSGDFNKGYDAHLTKLFGSPFFDITKQERHDLPDGTLLSHIQVEGENGKQAHSLCWSMTSPTGKAIDYEGLFTPDEYDHIKSGLEA